MDIFHVSLLVFHLITIFRTCTGFVCMPSSAFPRSFAIYLRSTDEQKHNEDGTLPLTRRAFCSTSAIILVLIGKSRSSFAQGVNSSVSNYTIPSPSQNSHPVTTAQPTKSIEPIDIHKVVRENKINITVYENENTKVYINSTSFYKMKEREFPQWIPAFLLPKLKPEPFGKITNAELLTASAIAGSITETVRSSILYPITTIKTRIQASPPSKPSTSFREMLRTFAKSIMIQTKTGDLYAGFAPSMIASVPASGVYFGVSDVMKREIRQYSSFDELSVILGAVLIADVVSLAVRTPAVIFSVRKQAAKMVDVETVEDYDEEGNLVNILDIDTRLDISDEQMGQEDNSEDDDWWDEFLKDCVRQLPVIILTDLPYLLLKISLLKCLAHGNENIVQYDVLNICCAIVASGLTTPFDVARTRILVDSDRNATNGLDGGSDENIIEAMKKILYENVEEGSKRKARIENLYAGWFERIFYFGIGLAWLEPIRILCYYGLRDAILLEVFP